LVIGHWSLVIGHWSLVIGHWSLVIGHWSLVIGDKLRFCPIFKCLVGAGFPRPSWRYWARFQSQIFLLKLYARNLTPTQM